MARKEERARGRRGPGAGFYRSAIWIFVAAWILVCTATLGYNGPAPDEGVSITSGLRTLEGHGLSDGYLGWFKGSLLWPTIAGFGYRFAGLQGSRYFALLLAGIALLAVARGTRHLFGPQAGLLTAVSLSLSGSFVALARLAVFDVLALSAVGLAFWSVTKLTVTDNRIWLVLTAAALSAATASRYSAGLATIPIVWMIVGLRDRKANLDVGILLFLSFALVMTVFLPHRERLTAPSWGIGNGSFAALGNITARTVYLAGVPLVFGAAALFVLRTRRRAVPALLGSLAIWPIYHLFSPDAQDLFRHLALASVLAYPLVGAVLAQVTVEAASERHLRRLGLGLYLVLIAGLGLVQVRELSRTWPDVRETADFLLGEVRPGQQLLIDPGWPYAMYLYGEGRVDSPWAIYDAHRLPGTSSTEEICGYDLFVEMGNHSGWSERVRDTVPECESSSKVFTASSPAVSFGSSFRYEAYPVETNVWSRHGPR